MVKINKSPKRKIFNQKGSVAFGVLALAALILEIGAATLFVTSTNMKRAVREENNVILLQLAEAGIQEQLDYLWNVLAEHQDLTDIDEAYSIGSPLTMNGELQANHLYQVFVNSVQNTENGYARDVEIIATGWIDKNGDETYNAGTERQRTIRTVVRFSLTRSGVFDYAYFMNNYGWFYGFSSTNMIANGDLRSNADFTINGGTPTVNGSIFAAPNNKLIPPATGTVNVTPNQWSNLYYANNASSRARQSYNELIHGSKNSAQYKNWQDLIYDQNGSFLNEKPDGSILGDKSGIRDFQNNILDPEPMTELPMPDLSDISRYINISQNYTDTKQTYNDGTPNPTYGQEAYIEVWNSSLGTYQRITINGVVNGNAVLVGTDDYPIKIHGPVTVTQDVIIKGTVDGQGTIYTGRNIHILGSVKYKNPPNFKGSDAQTIDNANEKKTILGLAARESIIMGNYTTSSFRNNVVNKYMKPPFTKPRYDEKGNYIPAYDGTAKDSYGKELYKSLVPDATITSLSSPIEQIDAVLYTNKMTGGTPGVSGKGITFNGSLISKDEAMVVQGLPLVFNYDNRIKERSLNQKPLIDIELPRTPNFKNLVWQEL